MSLRVIFHDLAERELHEAAVYYFATARVIDDLLEQVASSPGERSFLLALRQSSMRLA